MAAAEAEAGGCSGMRGSEAAAHKGRKHPTQRPLLYPVYTALLTQPTSWNAKLVVLVVLNVLPSRDTATDASWVCVTKSTDS